MVRQHAGYMLQRCQLRRGHTEHTFPQQMLIVVKVDALNSSSTAEESGFGCNSPGDRDVSNMEDT